MRAYWSLGLVFAASSLMAGDCSALKTLKLQGTTINTAEELSGSFQPPYGPGLDKLPQFCHVTGVLTPTTDSEIQFEVWMPAENWNGKFRGLGNGGFAGSIDFRGLGGSVSRGYASASTNTGHDGDSEDASWAYHHPEKVIDFGYRAIHLTTVTAKAVIQAYYGQAPRKSYFDACSNGGREALMEAQRFPEDYDGILAGAPAYDWTHLVASGFMVSAHMVTDPASYVSSTKLRTITDAALRACDAQDGLKDGIVADLSRCHFNPSVLECHGPENRTCLTKPQVETLKQLYDGVGGAPGLVPGSEAGSGGWSGWVTGAGPGGAYSANYVANYMRYMVFDDPRLNVLGLSAKEAETHASEKTCKILNATSPDLKPFAQHGGKLILYHGWNDPAISPYYTTRYYDALNTTLGASQVQQFVRVYMAPGVGHCFGGPGPNAFGQLGISTAQGPKFGLGDALEAWVENGVPPREVVATKYAEDSIGGKVRMTRPICPYPQVARYKGSGDSNEASSFSCESQ